MISPGPPSVTLVAPMAGRLSIVSTLRFQFAKTTTIESVFVCLFIVVFAFWFSLYVAFRSGVFKRKSNPSFAFLRSSGV